MKKFRYMRINSKHIPDEVMIEYDLHDKLHDNYIYVEIRKGIYGLKEAGIIAFQRLVKNLAPHGYRPMRYTPGMWRHDSLPTTFTLAVDDFGIKYFNKEHHDHLLNALCQDYTIGLRELF